MWQKYKAYLSVTGFHEGGMVFSKDMRVLGIDLIFNVPVYFVLSE